MNWKGTKKRSKLRENDIIMYANQFKLKFYNILLCTFVSLMNDRVLKSKICLCLYIHRNLITGGISFGF